jgi:type IV pilus assembly protein PilA
MKSAERSTARSAAFSVVEVMIVVAIIAVVTLMAAPAIIKPRKQSQGRRIVNDARQLDAAINQWAIEKSKKDGDAVITSEAATYLKCPWFTNDVLGNSYAIGTVGPNQIQISSATKTSLAGVGIDWGPY